MFSLAPGWSQERHADVFHDLRGWCLSGVKSLRSTPTWDLSPDLSNLTQCAGIQVVHCVRGYVCRSQLCFYSCQLHVGYIGLNDISAKLGNRQTARTRQTLEPLAHVLEPLASQPASPAPPRPPPSSLSPPQTLSPPSPHFRSFRFFELPT